MKWTDGSWVTVGRNTVRWVNIKLWKSEKRWKRKYKMSSCARQSGSGVVGSLHVLENTGPWHHHPPCFNTPEALWMPTFMDSSWGFIKQVFCLNHWPVGTVPNLSVLSFPQKCRKLKPVITPPRTLLTTFTTERVSSSCVWFVSGPMKDSKFQEF